MTLKMPTLPDLDWKYEPNTIYCGLVIVLTSDSSIVSLCTFLFFSFFLLLFVPIFPTGMQLSGYVARGTVIVQSA